MDPNPDYQVYYAHNARAIRFGFLVVIYIIGWIWNFISKTKKQADKTALPTPQTSIPVASSAAETIPSQIHVVTANSIQSDQRDNYHINKMTEAEKRATQSRIKQADEITVANDILMETANATQITIPVAPSAAATIPSQTTAVMSNAIKRDQREYIHINEMTEAEKRATQARIKQADEKAFANDPRAVTANTTQRDQLDNNFRNEMMEAEKRAVEAEKRVAEVEKRAAKAKKQATEAKKQADGTDLSNATQTTVPVAPSTAVAVQPRSLDERINALIKMKASGLITDAEFDQKRKELLDSI